MFSEGKFSNDSELIRSIIQGNNSSNKKTTAILDSSFNANQVNVETKQFT